MRNFPTTLFLSGGLGNVLLQIHFSKYLQQSMKASVLLNCNFVAPKVMDEVKLLFGDQIIIKTHRLGNIHISNRYFLGAFRKLKFWPFFVEPEQDQLINTKQLSSFLFISGYFQSYKYSDGWLFDPKIIESATSNENLSRIQQLSSEDIIMHLRFGDYLDQRTAKYHGLLNAKYYEEALERLKPNKRVIVVTNDAIAANTMLSKINWKSFEIWSGTRFSGLDDFFFISSASNIITSNSSFSYCAALQASRIRGAQVVVPKDWFNSRNICLDYRFPEDWSVL